MNIAVGKTSALHTINKRWHNQGKLKLFDIEDFAYQSSVSHHIQVCIPPSWDRNAPRTRTVSIDWYRG